MSLALFAVPETAPKVQKTAKQDFDVFKAINKGILTKEDIISISKVPWFNMWVRKELRKSFARSRMTREGVKTFNASMRANYTTDNAINQFGTPNEVDKFLGVVTNMSVNDYLKTKVLLSVLYPKVKLE